MAGINNILNIGYSALQANQTALSVTGNNIANVNTEGYSRQTVRFADYRPINAQPGQLGTGVYAAEIERQFNRQLENAYLEKNTDAFGWGEQANILGTVETFFNEANTDGTHSQLSSFLNAWGDLSTTADHLATREAILSQAKNLTKLLNSTQDNLNYMNNEMEMLMQGTVDEVNRLIEVIADINTEIAKNHVPGINNANALLDERDRLVRELSQYVNVVVKDKGPDDFSIYLEDGMPLVEDESVYSLSMKAPFHEISSTKFNGTLHVDGLASDEYTLEFINNSEFKVSLDGGKTWLSDDSGETIFTVPPSGEKIKVGQLTLTFDDPDLPPGSPLEFEQGDNFYIVPKSSITWNSPTRGPVDLETAKMEELGGKLGAYVTTRDNTIREVMERMDGFSRALIWEINSLHSQGAGTEPMTYMMGTYSVKDSTGALGDSTTGLAFGEKLTAGSLSMHFTDTTTGQNILSAALNFGPRGSTPPVNFDPEIHSLSDVVTAINNTYHVDGTQLIKAEIHNGALQLTTAKDVGVQMGGDTSGLLAALGINTFFDGSGAGNIKINQHVEDNINHINAASIDGSNEGSSGDGDIATSIAQLASKKVDINSKGGTHNESLLSYYAGIVGVVGSKTSTANYNANYYNTLTNDLNDKTAAVSGVNLDQELTLMIRYQHSYTSAAKLITTANEMFEILLSLKQ